MYSLLMTAREGAWNDPTFEMPTDRFLEYTHEAIQTRFRSLSDSVVEQLKALPALFAYERYLEAPAKVGRITEIRRGVRNIGITLSADTAIPEIKSDVMASLLDALDIDAKFEVNRTHWAIKEVDLHGTLQARGLANAAARPQEMRPPKVFISYSWDSPEHKQWVAQLGGYLRQHGIDVILDQWHVRYGDDLAAFMNRSVREADRVLVICTEAYLEKAIRRAGGVGYELMMVSGELMRDVGTAKFIPVVVQSLEPSKLPPDLATRLFFDLRYGPTYNDKLLELARELHNVRVPIPPIGPNPFVS